jgi:hypothetical protein|tara:strand:+ start:319 stop:678 length:360 start_codon:yes stop_codon:yes gene_type:complete
MLNEVNIIIGKVGEAISITSAFLWAIFEKIEQNIYVSKAKKTTTVAGLFVHEKNLSGIYFLRKLTAVSCRPFLAQAHHLMSLYSSLKSLFFNGRPKNRADHVLLNIGNSFVCKDLLKGY